MLFLPSGGGINFSENGGCKITDYTLDGGKTWNPIGSVIGPEGPQGPQGPQGPEGPQGPQGPAGQDGDSMFKSITVGEDYVTIVLNDGHFTTLQLPIYKELKLDLPTELEVEAGETVTVKYQITGTYTSPKISLTTSNGWIANIKKTDAKSGSITIKAPSPFVDGTVTVFASEGTHTTMEVITFTKKEPAPVVVESVTINPSSVSIEKGGTKKLNVIITPSAAAVGKTIFWSSTNEGIAKVNASGYATAVSEGSCIIKATVDGIIGSCVVTVTDEGISGGGGGFDFGD